MLFLQVFIRISIQFGGFSKQHQENQRTKSPQNFAEDFLSRLSGYFSEFLQNAGKFSKIFQDAGKFYKIFHAGSLIFLCFIKN